MIAPMAERQIRRVKPAKRMLGDKAYDSAELRDELDERGTKRSFQIAATESNRFAFWLGPFMSRCKRCHNSTKWLVETRGVSP